MAQRGDAARGPDSARPPLARAARDALVPQRQRAVRLRSSIFAVFSLWVPSTFLQCKHLEGAA